MHGKRSEINKKLMLLANVQKDKQESTPFISHARISRNDSLVQLTLLIPSESRLKVGYEHQLSNQESIATKVAAGTCQRR